MYLAVSLVLFDGEAQGKIFCCEAVAQIFCDQYGLVLIILVFIIVEVWNCAHYDLPVILYIAQKRLDTTKKYVRSFFKTR